MGQFIARWITVFLFYALMPGAASAEPFTLEGPRVQGGMIVGQVVPGSQVSLDGTPLKLGPDGRFVFGFNRDAAKAARLDVVEPSGARFSDTLSIKQRKYEIQRIDGLPPKKVTPRPEVYERLKRERGMVAQARAHDTDFLHWAGPFIWPAVGRISGVYGSQRILNGEPRQPHFGVDVAAPKGTQVVAPAAGIVVLAEPDFYYEGGIIIIDHGHRVMSTLFHLQTVDIETGDTLVQGQPIATIGATGRATGAHVDWRVNWGAVRLDAALIVGPMPSSQ